MAAAARPALPPRRDSQGDPRQDAAAQERLTPPGALTCSPVPGERGDTALQGKAEGRRLQDELSGSAQPCPSQGPPPAAPRSSSRPTARPGPQPGYRGAPEEGEPDTCHSSRPPRRCRSAPPGPSRPPRRPQRGALPAAAVPPYSRAGPQSGGGAAPRGGRRLPRPSGAGAGAARGGRPELFIGSAAAALGDGRRRRSSRESPGPAPAALQGSRAGATPPLRSRSLPVRSRPSALGSTRPRPSDLGPAPLGPAPPIPAPPCPALLSPVLPLSAPPRRTDPAPWLPVLPLSSRPREARREGRGYLRDTPGISQGYPRGASRAPRCCGSERADLSASLDPAAPQGCRAARRGGTCLLSQPLQAQPHQRLYSWLVRTGTRGVPEGPGHLGPELCVIYRALR
ncbi:translation initiation factor IF-2-like [Corvus kubaryi]|uniref:translation initiation factor IF-2-like n=1 Tax=Corvus kubaryi TaxID=68294 RepID=UPI001C04B99D|nr:translation initiation factor IF-2-like [Corvus kubaryi]